MNGTDSSKPLPPIQLREHTASGADIDARTAPYWVRGRDHETAAVVSKLSTMPCAITVIAGSPGSGKSTMITHIKEYLEYLGINTVELSNDDFASEVTLTDALLNVKSMAKSTPDGQNQAKARELGADAKLFQFKWGGTRANSTSHQRPLTWRLALQQLGQGEGTLILMDEAQRLDRLHEHPDRAELVGDFMNELHSKHMRQPERKLALLCCGLSHTQRVLNSFKMTRVENRHVFRLGPLSTDASHQILQDNYTAKTESGDSLPPPPAELLKQLVEASGGCPHHLAWAGCRLQQQALIVRESGRTGWAEEDTMEVLVKAEDDRIGLYNNRMDMGNDAAAEAAQALAFTLATAVESYGRPLPRDLVKRLSTHFGETAGKQSAPAQTLIEKGVIELRENSNEFLTVDRTKPWNTHYAFPIHSMARWLREVKQVEEGATWTREDSLAILDKVRAEGQQVTQIPEWHWNYGQRRAVIPKKMWLPERGIDATNREHPVAVPAPERSWLMATGRLIKRLFVRKENPKLLTADHNPARIAPPPASDDAALVQSREPPES